MKHRSKNSTLSGNSPRKRNNFQYLRLYLIFNTLVLFVAIAIYSQILIRNAKREQEYVPRIFAKYIAYTENYLRQSEKYALMLAEITSKTFEALNREDFQEAISNYMLFEFPQKNPIPVIITDIDLVPQLWNQVGVSPDSTYDSLSEQSKQILQNKMKSMDRIELKSGNQVVNYVYIARPLSLQEFLKDIDYSVVVTDRDKKPLYWRNVEVPEDKTWEQIAPEDKLQLQKTMKNMYEVYLGDTSDQLGYIYFTTPKYLPRIRYLVLLELALALLLVGFSSYGLFLLNRTEKDTLWIGLAKETAHQFGTPITSLMGWIDLLREAPEEGISSPELSKMLDYMTTDLNQLKNIASRFGKVGSQTKLVPTELHTILQQTVSYFKDRLPHLGSKMDIHLISKIPGIKVMLDTELFTWAMENLIKNCIDAMSQKGGNIFITATHNNKYVFIHIRDEGKGIPHSQWKKIFEPGITTKTRGWGLGLSLAKRIIEEYHQGVIKVLTSTINEGTTIEIRLNIAEQEEEKK